MGISKFSRDLYKRENIENKTFILAIGIIIAFMYNVINTYYNEMLIDLSPGLTEITVNLMNGGTAGEYSMIQPLVGVVKGNIFIVLATASILIIFSSNLYTKEKSKNMACMMYSGGSFSDALKFLIHNSIKSFFIAIIGGITIGMLLSPLYNWIIYKSIGYEGQLFIIEWEGIGLLVGFLVIILIATIAINWGFVYRNDVMGLMKIDSAKRIGDKRRWKMHWEIMIFLYMIPFILLLVLPKNKGIQGYIEVGSYISLVILYWLIKYGIEEIFQWLKVKEFMYKKNRIIYFSNAIKTIKDSFMYIFICLYCLIYTLDSIGDILDKPGLKENLGICIIGIGVCIAVSIGYKLIVEFKFIIGRSDQMRSIGFSKEEILECVNAEVLTIFSFVTMLPLLIVVANIFGYVIEGKVSSIYGFTVSLGILIPSYIIALGVSVFFKRKIERNLNSKNNRDNN